MSWILKIIAEIFNTPKDGFLVVPKGTVCECGSNKQKEDTYCLHCLEKLFWGDL